VSGPLENAERHIAERKNKKALRELWMAAADHRRDPTMRTRIVALATEIAEGATGRTAGDAKLLAKTLEESSPAQAAPAGIPAPQPAALTRRGDLRLRAAAGVLFVAAGLTVFLPYFSVNKYEGRTYHYTGVRLMTGSYPTTSPPAASSEEAEAGRQADDGGGDPFFVVFAAAVGLLTLRVRRNRAVAVWLIAIAVIVLLLGSLSTTQLDALFGTPWDEHLRYGFWLGFLAIAGATVIRIILWLVPIADASETPAPVAPTPT
jgi:hypothetical protein